MRVRMCVCVQMWTYLHMCFFAIRRRVRWCFFINFFFFLRTFDSQHTYYYYYLLTNGWRYNNSYSACAEWNNEMKNKIIIITIYEWCGCIHTLSVLIDYNILMDVRLIQFWFFIHLFFQNSLHFIAPNEKFTKKKGKTTNRTNWNWNGYEYE